jgi:hypothetical protein
MECGAPSYGAQDRFYPLVIRNKQGSGGGAHEDLDAAATWQTLEFAQGADVFVRGADVEAVVAVHPPPGPRQLVEQGFGIGRGRVGVGHLEHRGHASEHRRPGAGFEILLPFEAGLAKVNLAVDDAGQDGQASRIHHRVGRGRGQIADRREPAVADANVGEAAASVADDITPADDQIKDAGHATVPKQSPR